MTDMKYNMSYNYNTMPLSQVKSAVTTQAGRAVLIADLRTRIKRCPVENCVVCRDRTITILALEQCENLGDKDEVHQIISKCEKALTEHRVHIAKLEGQIDDLRRELAGPSWADVPRDT